MAEQTYREKIEEIAAEPVWTTLEDGNPCKDTTVWTSSKLSTIGNCLWAYHLAFDLGAIAEHRSINAVRGSSLHKFANRMHKEKKWGDWLDIYQEVAKETLANENESDIPWRKEMDEEKQHEFLIEDGTAIAGNYVAKNRDARVVGTEIPFRMVLKNPKTDTRYRLAGTIDQLREMGGGQLGIFDLKSDAAAPDWAYLARTKQFGIYGLALNDGVLWVDDEPRRFGTYPDQMVWYQLHHLLPYKKAGKRSDGTTYVKGDLRGDPIIPVTRTREDFEFERADICRAIQTVRMGLVWKSGAGNQTICAMCRYRNACTTGMVVRQQSGVDLTQLADRV